MYAGLGGCLLARCTHANRRQGPKAKLVAAVKNIREPVPIDLPDGRVYASPAIGKAGDTITFANLPLSDFPAVLCSRTGISIEFTR